MSELYYGIMILVVISPIALLIGMVIASIKSLITNIRRAK